jgi:hypothetical protein
MRDIIINSETPPSESCFTAHAQINAKTTDESMRNDDGLQCTPKHVTELDTRKLADEKKLRVWTLSTICWI